MGDHTTEIGQTEVEERGGSSRQSAGALALVVAWCRDEPERAGQVILVSRRATRPLIFGRGEAELKDGEARAELVQQRPGENVTTPPLAARRVSRRQLRLQPLKGGKLLVENLGRCPLELRGSPVDQAVLTEGDRIELAGQMLLMLTTRPNPLPGTRSYEAPLHAFGGPDPCGLVGESPAAWQLRDLIGFIGPRAGHVLVLGDSGVGKELVARAIHLLSPRRGQRLISRNAATIPGSLMDAELFGHIKNYPNPGMAERPGLVGEADGSSLFLDEIGEIPDSLQAHLLRLMDSGEYQRLGDPVPRRADLRLIAATNRPIESLKSDFGARFRHVIRVPRLDQRVEDIPLLAYHLLRAATEDDPELRDRFFDERSFARLSPALVDALLVHPLPLQIRELDSLLWRCLAESTGDRVDLSETIETPSEAPEGESVDPGSLTAEMVQSALDRCNFVQEDTWRELGLNSRYQLRRLIKKFNLRTAPEE